MLDGGAMMSKYRTQIRDAALMTLILSVSFLSIVLMQKFYAMQTLAPMIFLLSVFLISLKTQGYFWGILASLLSVLAVNFAFTFPFFQFDFFIPENLFSALVTLCIAIMTSTLTTRIKQEERMRAESEREKVRANLLRAISHDLRTPLTLHLRFLLGHHGKLRPAEKRANLEAAGRNEGRRGMADSDGGKSVIRHPLGRQRRFRRKKAHCFGGAH